VISYPRSHFVGGGQRTKKRNIVLSFGKGRAVGCSAPWARRCGKQLRTQADVFFPWKGREPPEVERLYMASMSGTDFRKPPGVPERNRPLYRLLSAVGPRKQADAGPGTRVVIRSVFGDEKEATKAKDSPRRRGSRSLEGAVQKPRVLNIKQRGKTETKSTAETEKVSTRQLLGLSRQLISEPEEPGKKNFSTPATMKKGSV